jgi:hypothetical protein
VDDVRRRLDAQQFTDWVRQVADAAMSTWAAGGNGIETMPVVMELEDFSEPEDVTGPGGRTLGRAPSVDPNKWEPDDPVSDPPYQKPGEHDDVYEQRSAARRQRMLSVD